MITFKRPIQRSTVYALISVSRKDAPPHHIPAHTAHATGPFLYLWTSKWIAKSVKDGVHRVVIVPIDSNLLATIQNEHGEEPPKRARFSRMHETRYALEKMPAI